MMSMLCCFADTKYCVFFSQTFFIEIYQNTNLEMLWYMEPLRLVLSLQ